jgi:peroxiredoxin Q/BCP
MPLESGDKAPDFTLADQNSQSFTLSESLARRKARHLIYFYPKADTPGCTTQACGLRDVLAQVGDTVVVGVSPDKPAAQARFDAKYSLGFTLLSDPDKATAQAWGAFGEKKMYGKVTQGIIRSAFLVGADGNVEHAWYKISPKDTPTKLLAALSDA